MRGRDRADATVSRGQIARPAERIPASSCQLARSRRGLQAKSPPGASSLPSSLLVRCLYRPGEFFGQLIGWPLQLAVTGLRRRRGWIRVGHRRHAGHRDQPPANLHPLARSWKTSLSDHAQSCRAADPSKSESARPNVLIVQYLQNFQIADRHPGDAVGPMRRALHHCLCPVGCHIGFAYVSKDVLPADEALEAWRQVVATRRTEDGTHAVEILDRVAVDRRLPIEVAGGCACLVRAGPGLSSRARSAR